jgi:hypothetical protein
VSDQTPQESAAAARRRRGMFVAWAMVVGVFVLGYCCGGVTIATAFLSVLSD